MKQRVHILVSGRVQGVSFRAYTQQRASAFGLRGYVRNLPNGDVEIVAEGEREAFEKLLEWARHGPSGAAVMDVQVDLSEADDSFPDFSIRY